MVSMLQNGPKTNSTYLVMILKQTQKLKLPEGRTGVSKESNQLYQPGNNSHLTNETQKNREKGRIESYLCFFGSNHPGFCFYKVMTKINHGYVHGPCSK